MPTGAEVTKKRTMSGEEKGGGAALRLIVTNPDYGKLVRRFMRKLSRESRSKLDLQTYSSWDEMELPKARLGQWISTLIVSRVADIPERLPARAPTDPLAKHLLFSEGIPIEGVASRLPRLNIRDAHRLHVAHERDPESIRNIVFRTLMGITDADGLERIVDAWVEDERLVLLSPSFERLSVPLEKLRRYIGSDPEEAANFEIDEDGSFVYWPHADAHFGWEQFLYLVDPAAAVAARQKTEAFNRRYGAAIRSLREKAGLKQSDIKGITERNLRRVEHGELAASKATLVALARAHGLPLEDYLKDLAAKFEGHV